MNILVAFESSSLLQGLTKYEDRRSVNVALSLVFQWLLDAVHRKLTASQVIECVNQIAGDTYSQAEYMLSSNTQIDYYTGLVSEIRYPLIHHEDGDKKYGQLEYNTSHNNWFHRYAEIVEHIVLHYTDAVMGFFQSLEKDKHVVSIQHVTYTPRYVTLVVMCWNLIEYKGSVDGPDT